MKAAYRPLVAVPFLGGVLIVLSAAISYKQHDSSIAIMPPLLVSLTEHQYEKNEPVTISVSFTNPLRRQITICRLSFGLSKYYGEEGFYINDDEIRHRCRGHYVSDSCVCGMVNLILQPKDAINETIIIPAEAGFAPGSHKISYELRLPFYGNEKQFSHAPGDTITVYLDPRDRPLVDTWRQNIYDFINGNGEFTVKGKLGFVVK